MKSVWGRRGLPVYVFYPMHFPLIPRCLIPPSPPVLPGSAVDMDSALLIPLLCGNLMRIPPSAYNVLHNPLLTYQSLVEEFISKTSTAFKEVSSSD